MFKRLALAVLVGSTLSVAHADAGVRLNIGIGIPLFNPFVPPPRPVYVAPAPVYVTPAPVYAAPAPVIVRYPQPVTGPYYVQPPPVPSYVAPVPR
jgi:hypothetical protein